MKFSISRESLLSPLQLVQGVVERRQTVPILSNILLRAREGKLTVVGTDLEVEFAAYSDVDGNEDGDITVPAKKFTDICRALPMEAQIKFEIEGDRATIRSGQSRFTLSTLPTADFPASEEIKDVLRVSMDRQVLKRLMDLTAFAMAHQDVRYYLNGMLLEIWPGEMKAVATDGHRLAMARCDVGVEGLETERQIILPRKGVMETLRMLGTEEGVVDLNVGSGVLQVVVPEGRLTSKLIDGRFPDYEAVIPSAQECEKEVIGDRELVRQSLSRAAILCNEKYRAVRLVLEENLLRVFASNPDQEEAEEEVKVRYTGERLEVGFNVLYLMEAVAIVPSEVIRMGFTDASNSCLIQPEGREDCRFVVMPMRL